MVQEYQGTSCKSHSCHVAETGSWACAGWLQCPCSSVTHRVTHIVHEWMSSFADERKYCFLYDHSMCIMLQFLHEVYLIPCCSKSFYWRLLLKDTWPCLCELKSLLSWTFSNEQSMLIIETRIQSLSIMETCFFLVLLLVKWQGKANSTEL